MGYTIKDNDTRHNGWTNYATWRVSLEMFDGVDIRDWCDVRTCDAYDLSKQLSEYADDMISNYGNSETLAVDYARAFLSDVNWHEIAEHLLEAIRDEVAA